MNHLKISLSLAALSLASCGNRSGEQGEEAAPAPAVSPVASSAVAPTPTAFARCRSCHAVEPGVNGIGPSLHAIVGQHAARVPGYSYSAALKRSGIVWNAESLDKWLAAPMTMVPGTKMALGAPDPEQRGEIVAYLETLK